MLGVRAVLFIGLFLLTGRAGRGWYYCTIRKSQIVKALLRSDNKEDHEINVLGYLVKLVRMEFARPVGYSSTEQCESQNATP